MDTRTRRPRARWAATCAPGCATPATPWSATTATPTSADVGSLAEMVEQLPSPKVVWVMVPAGDPTRDTVKELGELLGEGDLVVDGGNSRWTDDQAERRAARREGHRLRRLRRLRRRLGPGERLRPDVRRLRRGRREGAAGLRRAQARGRLRLRARRQAPGAGHFAKMVHNGIEYAIMQAYAEGWELLEKVDLVDNVTEVFDSWREGTVIRSWLLDLLVAALEDDTHLDKIAGYAEDSGEGRWTVEAGIDNARRRCRRSRPRCSPASSPAGRQPGDEGGRGDAQPVRRPRGAHRAAARRRRVADRPEADETARCTSPT